MVIFKTIKKWESPFLTYQLLCDYEDIKGKSSAATISGRKSRNRGPGASRNAFSSVRSAFLSMDAKFDLERQPCQGAIAEWNESLRSAGLSRRCGVRSRSRQCELLTCKYRPDCKSALSIRHPVPSLSLSSFASSSMSGRKTRHRERQEATIPFPADPALMNFPVCTQSHFRLLSWRLSRDSPSREAGKMCTRCLKKDIGGIFSKLFGVDFALKWNVNPRFGVVSQRIKNLENVFSSVMNFYLLLFLHL